MVTASTASLANGLTLSIAEQGDPDGPAVVFLPGPTDSWISYAQVLEHMPDSIRAVAVSQRGHGDSTKPPDGYRVEDFAGDVPLLLDALNIGRATLVGHSGSGLTVRRVAIDYPDRVTGLVLEASPTTLAGHPGLTAFVDGVVLGLSDPIDPDFARSVVIDTSSPDINPELLEMLIGELLKVPARAWHEMFGALLTYADRDDLARITAPTLLMWGDGDAIVHREMQDELLGRIANATLVVYPGAGHTPRWDEPKRFAADVAAFVDSA